MENTKTSLIQKINKITLDIETNHKELYRSLNEMPMTIPNMEHPEIDVKALVQYKDNLTQVLNHFLTAKENNHDKYQ